MCQGELKNKNLNQPEKTQQYNFSFFLVNKDQNSKKEVNRETLENRKLVSLELYNLDKSLNLTCTILHKDWAERDNLEDL